MQQTVTMLNVILPGVLVSLRLGSVYIVSQGKFHIQQCPSRSFSGHVIQNNIGLMSLSTQFIVALSYWCKTPCFATENYMHSRYCLVCALCLKYVLDTGMSLFPDFKMMSNHSVMDIDGLIPQTSSQPLALFFSFTFGTDRMCV